MSTILDPSDDYNITGEEGRKAIALRGLSYMSAYPLFGVGMSNFGRAEAFIGRADDQRAGIGVRWLAPHNTYVQVGAEMGFFALMTWLTLLGAGTVGLVRLRNRLPRHWIRGTPRQQFLYTGTVFLPASFVAFAASSMFLSFAYLTPMYLLVGLMAALHVQISRERRVERVEFLSRATPMGPVQPGHILMSRNSA
jgi:O-antigen ligase